ncbi:DNA translocase FtsK [Sporosarcina pasteurii]|uniref:Septum-associated FtsK-like translocase of DNA n=1 Tax=Sporosarcina pasteurii TaxID=1474 RepID=A0A380C730_SPOPA|nr:DNA translocase FtsK [Sporosarcina pasteurii]SUJ13682.1 Septum-associated FtsK-like translocase of DNA [Sporosarcina pasteurii]
MLKWFKTLTNRLFGEEVEEKQHVENMDDQYKNENNPSEQKTRPAFRFPIITDAEIYGWDEDDLDDYPRQVAPSSSNQELDDYEPIPLYKNERWPSQNVQVNVHRASQSPREKVIEKEEVVPEQVESPSSDTTDTASRRKTSDRFVPTKVPSPIYGFSPPKEQHSVDEDEKKTEQYTLHQEQSAQEKESKKEILQDNKTEERGFIQETTRLGVVEEEPEDPQVNVNLAIEESEAPQVNEELSQYPKLEDSPRNEIQSHPGESIQDELINQQKELELNHEDEMLQMEEQSTQIEEQHQDVTVSNQAGSVSSLENAVSPMVEAETVVEEQASHQINDKVHPEKKERIEEPAMTCLEEQAETEKSLLQNNEDHKSEGAATIETEQVAEQKRERIVPFNVLMLKSDKEKLKSKEKETPRVIPVQPSVQDNQTIEKTEVVVEDKAEETPEFEHYVFPSIEYLVPPESQIEDTEWLTSQSEKLEESLSHFGVQANVIDAVQGPTVTRFELTVGQGTKVSRVRNLTDDLKLTLAARDIRIQAPIPGKSSIGIEIPNRNARAVRISEVIQTDSFRDSDSPLEAVLGLGLTGEPVTLDLRKMPHGMIAGATGSGKSVCINSILISLLYKASPAELKMMLIDPKMVELAPFNGIPHLISPVITDVKAATAALKWAVTEMERRYELLAHAGVRDIERYNKQVLDNRQFSLKMPYLLIVIDELADLMMMAPSDVEVSISRIAQKARACGIHLIIATQRPSVDVITGIIKANIPTRIAFSVSSQVDSRTMIDTNGAERLLGRGDMLYVGNGESSPVRLQGTFVTDDEIERIIEHVQNEASPTYLFGQEELLKSAVDEEEDPLFLEACQFIYEQDSASTSMLQRNFSIGYNRAAKLMDRLEKLDFISPQQGSRARDVYLTESDLNELKETIL